MRGEGGGEEDEEEEEEEEEASRAAKGFDMECPNLIMREDWRWMENGEWRREVDGGGRNGRGRWGRE